MAHAVQEHRDPEGLISHLLGHLLFIAGLVFLLTHMKWKNMLGTGWKRFKCFFIIIISWNLLTFFSHLQDRFVSEENFIQNNKRITGFIANEPLDFLYYASKFDHLLLIPAFVCLAIALRKWGQQ